MGVANQFLKVLVAINEHRFVTPLEQVTGTVLTPAYPSGGAKREILHDLGEGLIRHLDDKVHVVRHEAERFAHTLPQINYYTHGSQVTVSHGHLAFFGAYTLLNLTVFYYAIPILKGIEVYQPPRAKVGFWTMCSTMMLMGLTFGVAGVLQAYMERVLGMGYMTAQSYMRF